MKAEYAHVPTFYWYETTYLGGAMRLDARVTWNTWVARPKRNEAPLIGGEWRFFAPWGPRDQRTTEKRDDVLVKPRRMMCLPAVDEPPN